MDSFMNFISSPITGNIIGAISLIVSIIGLGLSLCINVRTLKIEKRLSEEKAKAINKVQFKEFRTEGIKSLNSRQRAVKRTNTVSKTEYNDILWMCSRLKGYKHELLEQDLQEIDEVYDKLKMYLKDSNSDINNDVVLYFEVSSTLIRILERGEYDI